MSAGRDVIVAGGGPGGAVCASTLARHGCRVLLLEQAPSPRDHVGGSLSPAAWDAVQQLGVSDDLRAARFAPKAGATFAWGDDPWPWTVAYQAPAEVPATCQVRRAEFDTILRRAASAAGAEVRLGWRANEVICSSGRAAGVLATSPDGQAHRLAAPWVVDASGAVGLLSSHLGRVPGPPELDNAAVWARWRRDQETRPSECDNSLLVGRGSTCYWYYPLDDQATRAVVGVVVPARSGLPSADGLEAFYRTAVSRCSELEPLLSGAVLDAPVRAADACAYASSRMAGPGWFLAGDAACFVDPLLTPGVQLAVQHGMLAAQCLLTIIQQPAAEPEAIDLYDHVVRREYETFTRLSCNLYRAAAAARTGGTRAQQGGAPEVNGQAAFLSLISGLPRAELTARLGRFIAYRKAAAAATGAAITLGEKEGYSFLAWLFHQDELASARAGRCLPELGEQSVLTLAPGVTIGEHMFVPAGQASTLLRRTAARNRFGDRFLASPELVTLFAVLGAGCPYGEAQQRFCEAQLIPEGACRAGFGDWIEVLADHALVEWRPAGEEATCDA